MRSDTQPEGIRAEGIGDAGEAGEVGQLAAGEGGGLMWGEAPRKPMIDGLRDAAGAWR